MAHADPCSFWQEFFGKRFESEPNSLSVLNLGPCADRPYQFSKLTCSSRDLLSRRVREHRDLILPIEENCCFVCHRLRSDGYRDEANSIDVCSRRRAEGAIAELETIGVRHFLGYVVDCQKRLIPYTCESVPSIQLLGVCRKVTTKRLMKLFRLKRSAWELDGPSGVQIVDCGRAQTAQNISVRRRYVRDRALLPKQHDGQHESESSRKPAERQRGRREGCNYDRYRSQDRPDPTLDPPLLPHRQHNTQRG